MSLSDSPAEEADSSTNDSELSHPTSDAALSTEPASPTSTPAEDSASRTADTSVPPAGETAEASISTTPAQNTAAAAHQSFLQLLREKHQVDFTGKYKSDDEAIKGLLHAASAVGRRDQYAELGRHVEPHWQEFQRWQQSQNAPQQPAQQAAPSAPTKDPSWERWTDAETEDGLKANTPLEVRSAIEKYQEHYRAWQHKLVYQPKEALSPFFDEFKTQIRQEILGEMQQQQQHVQQRMQADGLRDQHAHWIYQQSQDGKFITDEYGHRIQTPAGAAFIENVGMLARNGITDQQVAFNAALALTKEQFAAMAPAAAPVIAAKPPVRTPNSNAGNSPSGKSVDTGKGTTLRERLLKKTEGMPDSVFAA